MTYSTTDTDDDGVVEADVDNQLVDTEELVTDPPPTTPFAWEGVHTLLHDGYCVNSRGQVYGPGGTAIQDAIDDLISNTGSATPDTTGQGRVWAGRDTYDPVTVSETSGVPITVQGMGRDITNIQANGGGPAFTLENPNYDQIGTYGFHMKDMELNAAGGGYPAMHLEGAHENWWTRVQFHQSDGATVGDRFINIYDSVRQWFTDCFAEGTPESDAVRIEYIGNNSPARIVWKGGVLSNLQGPIWQLHDPNAPSGRVNNLNFSGVDLNYNQVDHSWLVSNGCTNDCVMGGLTDNTSGNYNITADDDITFYGLV